MTTHKIALGIVLCLSGATPLLAQRADPADNAKMRIGPLAMTPVLSLTNIGVDNNVFNEPDQQAPKSDFTMTVEPKVDMWLHFGPSILAGNVTEDLVYYKEYANERSANTLLRLGVTVPMTRLSVNAGTRYLNTRERPGFEIDARSRRKELGYLGGVEFRVLSKSYATARLERTNVDFDKGEVFLGTDLHDELSRNISNATVGVRHALTTLTSLSFEVGRLNERFPYLPLRDANSTTATVSATFDPAALLKGSAAFGYRDFKPVDPTLPGYQGSTAQVNLSYVARESTKVDGHVARDVQYSYDINQPYYLLTDITVSVAQQIFGPIDVVGRGGVQRLDYQDRIGAVVAVSDRADHVRTFGLGVGYHLGNDVRIGFNVDKQYRDSEVEQRKYDNLTWGASVTYGL